jgi:hypothetical protein
MQFKKQPLATGNLKETIKAKYYITSLPMAPFPKGQLKMTQLPQQVRSPAI